MSRTPLSSSPSYLKSSPRKTMSLTQTYQLAHTARGKLSKEAARSEHRLHRLVTHANLLDGLMLELHTAEQEQERWFNQTVKKAIRAEEPRKVRWADSVVEEPEEDWQAEDAASDSSDSDAYDEDEPTLELDDDFAALKRVPSHSGDITTTVLEVLEEEEADDEEDLQRLALHLAPSHPPTTIPELDNDSDSSDDDEPMPKSPEASELLSTFSDKQNEHIITTSLFLPHGQSQGEFPTSQSKQPGFFDESLFALPPRPGESLVTAISVY